MQRAEAGEAPDTTAEEFLQARDLLRQGQPPGGLSEEASGEALVQFPTWARPPATVQNAKQEGEEEEEGVYGTPADDLFFQAMQGGLDVQAAADLAYGANPPQWVVDYAERAGQGGMSPEDIAYRREQTRALELQNEDTLRERDYQQMLMDREREQANLAASQWQQQFAADEAYRQAALAQQMAYQQAQLEQQRHEMAAQIGQAVANMSNQSYMNTLGQRLPAGTVYAPGFQPGGAMSALAGMSGFGYTPTPISVANPPTRDELMDIVRHAISQF